MEISLVGLLAATLVILLGHKLLSQCHGDLLSGIISSNISHSAWS